MGVNTLIYLPRDVRAHDVADVMGIIAGLPYKFERLSMGLYSDRDSKALRVEGAEAKGTDICGMSEINLSAPKGKTFVDGEEHHYCTYHHESSDPNCIMLYPKSTPFWIALGIRLARFFGGRVEFNDCACKGADRRFARRRKNNCPEDGKPWQNFQYEMATVKPITKDDLRRCQKYSAYDVPVV